MEKGKGVHNICIYNMYIIGERGNTKKRERERECKKGKRKEREKALIVSRTLSAMYTKNVHIICTVIGGITD